MTNTFPTFTIPARKPGWEHAYAVVLEKLADTPFQWGRADCLTRVADICKAMTGVNPLPARFRRYTTGLGAARQMKRAGHDSIEQALAATFPEVPRSRARRGDCGIGEVRVRGEVVQATFVVMGTNAIAANERGAVVISTLQLAKTFAIGWDPNA